MLLTGGFTLGSGLTFTPPAPPSNYATLDPATANSALTVTGQTVTLNTSGSGWKAVCSTNGARVLPTSTANPLSLSLELVLNANGGSGSWFFMGAVPTTAYSNSTLQLGFLGPGGYFGYLESGTAAGYGYTDGAGFAFLQAGGNYIPIHVGDVLGMSVEISATSAGIMDTTWYLNGNTAGVGYPFSFGVGTSGSITPFVAYQSPSGTPSVTLRTDPTTFSYGGSYTNQNGWPIV
jgi:hypothetical protein